MAKPPVTISVSFASEEHQDFTYLVSPGAEGWQEALDRFYSQLYSVVRDEAHSKKP